MLGGLFCYYLSVLFFRGCFLYLWSNFFIFVLVSPHPVFAFQLVLLNQRQSQTQILLATTVKWARRLHTEPCCFEKSMLNGFNFALCHVCMLNRSGGKCECGCSL